MRNKDLVTFVMAVPHK